MNLINVYISKKRDFLKYIIFDKIIVVLICIKTNSMLIKQNFVDAFKHIFVAKSI